MKLSTIAAIGLPLLGIAMLLILIATLTEKPVRKYVNQDVERAYEALKSPEERAAFDKAVNDYLAEAKQLQQAIKEQNAANQVQALIRGEVSGEIYGTQTEEQRQGAADFAAKAEVRQTEEQAKAWQSYARDSILRMEERERALEAPTATPTASITVVNGPMTPEQIHALINGPK